MGQLNGKIAWVTGAGGGIGEASAKAPSAEDLAKMLQADDLGAMVRYIAEAPPHVCINEVLISPTWNRSFTGVAELGGFKL